MVHVRRAKRVGGKFFVVEYDENMRYYVLSRGTLIYFAKPEDLELISG